MGIWGRLCSPILSSLISNENWMKWVGRSISGLPFYNDILACEVMVHRDCGDSTGCRVIASVGGQSLENPKRSMPTQPTRFAPRSLGFWHRALGLTQSLVSYVGMFTFGLQYLFLIQHHDGPMFPRLNLDEATILLLVEV